MAEEAAEPKRVSWAELFFDLVFVFAITQLSAFLHDHQSWAGVGRALVLFVPVYWMWVGVSVHADTRDVENPVDRLGIFAVGLGSLFMALAMTEAFRDRAVLFAGAYLGARIVLLALVLRTRRFFFNPFSVAVFASGPLRLIGAFLPEHWLLLTWAIAAVIDIVTPAVARRLVVAQVHFHPLHLSERFGLFLIIALGESIVAIGVPAAASAHLDLPVVLAVGIAFTLACGLWWIYFIAAAEAVEHAVKDGRVRADMVRQLLTYGHFALIGGIVAVAVGLGEVVHDPLHHLHLGTAAVLLGGAALYLATFGYISWRTVGHWPVRRLAAAALALLLVAVAPQLPALAILGILTALITMDTLAEHLPVLTRRTP